MKLEQIGAGGILARLPRGCAAGGRTVSRNGAGELLELVSLTGLTTFWESGLLPPVKF